MSRLPTWASWSLMAAVVLFSPALAFLLAMATEILIGLLIEARTIAVCTIAVGAIGWVLFRKASRRSKSPTSVSADGEDTLGEPAIAAPAV